MKLSVFQYLLKVKKALLFLLEKDINQCQSAVDIRKDMESNENEAKELVGKIPLGDLGDKIIRYETSIENQLYRAMNQLTKLQYLKQGLNQGNKQTVKVITVRSSSAEGFES